MINIPTDLLRTLVTVVDLRSFTRAAQTLGITQPAVSAQIKRLHALLGSDVLDKSAPGVSLTPLGEMIVDHARRLLSVNDHILGLAMPRPRSETIRVGVPGDFVSPYLPYTLAQFRLRWPDVRFHVRTDHYDSMMRSMRHGDIDLFVGNSIGLSRDARHQWQEDVVWVHSGAHAFREKAPVPLVSYGEICTLQRVAVDALNKAGRAYDVVYVSSSTASLAAAINAGLGVMALPRSRVAGAGLAIWSDTPLPKPASVYCGIYIREGGDRQALEQLADAIAGALNPALVLETHDRAEPSIPEPV